MLELLLIRPGLCLDSASCVDLKCFMNILEVNFAVYYFLVPEVTLQLTILNLLVSD